MTRSTWTTCNIKLSHHCWASNGKLYPYVNGMLSKIEVRDDRTDTWRRARESDGGQGFAYRWTYVFDTDDGEDDLTEQSLSDDDVKAWAGAL